MLNLIGSYTTVDLINQNWNVDQRIKNKDLAWYLAEAENDERNRIEKNVMDMCEKARLGESFYMKLMLRVLNYHALLQHHR